MIALPARAQKSESEAEREFRLGYRALQADDCVKALVHYRRSLALARRPRTLFNIATCEEDLGQDAAAWRDYQAFLAIAEDRDASIVSDARARLEVLRGRLRGRISVASSPAGASVHVDGARRASGITPVTLSLAPGPHVLRISMPDAVAVERTVEIRPDEVSALEVELALPSSITIVAEPADAMIEPHDGWPAAQGRLELAAAPGRHAFTVRLDGYVSEEVVVDAVAGRTHEARVSLRPEPATATLLVAGAPDLEVTIDGVAAAGSMTTAGALQLRDVPAGPHELGVSRPGRQAWRETLRFSPGEVVQIEVELPPRRSRGRRALGWGVGGLGVASLTAGGVVGVLALRDVTGPDPADHDRGKSRALLADGLFVVSAVALVAAWRLVRGERPSAVIHRAPGVP